MKLNRKKISILDSRSAMEYKKFLFEHVSFLCAHFVYRVSYIHLSIVDKILNLLKIVENIWPKFNGAGIIALCKLPIWKREDLFLTAFAWKERQVCNCMITIRELVCIVKSTFKGKRFNWLYSSLNILNICVYCSGPSRSFCTCCCSSLWPNASEIWLSHYYFESCEGTVFWICSICFLIFNIMLISVESPCNFGCVLN